MEDTTRAREPRPWGDVIGQLKELLPEVSGLLDELERAIAKELATGGGC